MVTRYVTPGAAFGVAGDLHSNRPTGTK